LNQAVLVVAKRRGIFRRSKRAEVRMALVRSVPPGSLLGILIGIGLVVFGATTVIGKLPGGEWLAIFPGHGERIHPVAGVLYFLSGLNLLLLVRRKRRSALVFAALLAAASAAALGESIIAVRPFHWLPSPFATGPGQDLAPGIAGMFLLGALGLAGAGRMPLAGVLIGSLLFVFALPSGSPPGFGTGLLPIQWFGESPAVTASAAFLGLASGLIAYSFELHPHAGRLQSWCRLLLAGGLAVAAGILPWRALRAGEADRMPERDHRVATSVARETESRLNALAGRLQAIAERSRQAERSPAWWAEELSACAQAFPGTSSLGRFRGGERPRWLARVGPDEGSDSGEADAALARLAEQVPTEKTSRVVRLEEPDPAHQPVFVVVPIRSEAPHPEQGCLVAELGDAGGLLESLGLAREGYRIELVLDGERLGGGEGVAVGSPIDSPSLEVPLSSGAWPGLRVRIGTSSDVLAARRTELFDWILVSSLAIALLLVVLIRLWAMEVARTRKLERLSNDHVESLERSERLLKRIQDVSGLLSADLELRAVAQEVIDAATEITGAKYGAFYCYIRDDNGTPVLLDVTSGADREAFAGFPRPRNLKTVGPNLSNRKAVRIADVRKHGHRRARHSLDVASYLAVPVVSASYEVWGALCFGHPAPGVFTADEERSARQLAAQFAIVVEKARLYQAERTARKRASMASRAKDHFLALLGHELRNPLGSLRTALEVLRQHPGAATEAEMREILERETHQMASLLDDLVDVARLNRGKLAFRRGRLDLIRLVAGTVESKRAEIEQAGLRLTLRVPPGSFHVDADPTRINQVVQNFLQNAVKFTDAGGEIEVTVRVDKEYGIVSVRDTGCGIAPEDQRAVFEAFCQGVNPERRELSGLGLGLHLAKAIVEAHGGQVALQSAGQGKGTIVGFRLPLKEGREASAPPTPPELLQGRRRILVVDDHEATALATRRLLELDGNTVEVAFNGASALTIARRLQPDVVLCDLGLPGLDGYAVARRLRELPETASARIYAATGFSGDDVSQQAFDAGFDGHLLKPLNSDRLKELLR
jgi:signal transduction histidine kinase